MEVNVFQRNKLILTEINELNVNETHIIYQPNLVPSQLNPIDVYFNGFIQDLRIKIDINSLTEVGLPTLEPELTEAEKLQLYTALEWSNARMELSVLRSADGQDWMETARLSLQNRAPYYSVDLLPFFTKQADAIVGNEWIALKVKDAGYGLLTGNDSLVIHGSCQLQAHYISGSVGTSLPVAAVSANSYGFTATDSSSLLMAANPQRKSASIVNITGEPCYLGFGTDAIPDGGIALIGKGASYTIDYSSMWLGDIYAITPSEYEQVLSCVEFV